MNTTIQFLYDPKYQDSVILFVLAPAGIQYDTAEIGKNLFGSDKWVHEALLIDRLAPKETFRYSDISFHWTDFLDLAFRHVDHALFYVPHKNTFKEIGKESLIGQNPDLYSFSFHKFVCEARKGMVQPPAEAVPPAILQPTAVPKSALKTKPAERPAASTTAVPVSAADKLQEARAALLDLIDGGWSANAVANVTGITAMTIGSIRNGKSTQASARVHAAIMQMKADADAGRITPAKRGKIAAQPAAAIPTRPAAPENQAGERSTRDRAPAPVKSPPASSRTTQAQNLRNNTYVAVDAEKLEAMIARLSTLFSEAISDLQEIRRQISG
ncbi:MAG: hypothetical protein IH600_17990 [Bacteroidetes bacterium]|nr:hypothetical protein [Bacteroidota bacterium]